MIQFLDCYLDIQICESLWVCHSWREGGRGPFCAAGGEAVHSFFSFLRCRRARLRAPMQNQNAVSAPPLAVSWHFVHNSHGMGSTIRQICKNRLPLVIFAHRYGFSDIDPHPIHESMLFLGHKRLQYPRESCRSYVSWMPAMIEELE